MTNAQMIAQIAVVVIIALLTTISGLLAIIAKRGWDVQKETKGHIKEINTKIDNVYNDMDDKNRLLVKDFKEVCGERQSACANLIKNEMKHCTAQIEENKKDIDEIKAHDTY